MRSEHARILPTPFRPGRFPAVHQSRQDSRLSTTCCDKGENSSGLMTGMDLGRHSETPEPNPVRHRKLGRTGMDLSTVGFGMWQLAGGRWKSPDDAECVNILQKAVECGINVFDAAIVYGQYFDENHMPH